MEFELRQLSVDDDLDLYTMLQDIAKDENGFMNACNGKSQAEYREWLVKSHECALGIGLEDWMVPQIVYWLFLDGVPVGMGKLRLYLTEKLREEGGHIGYAIRPKYRNLGYGKVLLKKLIEKAHEHAIDKILITVRNQNTASIKVALANGGHIDKITDVRHYIWFNS